MKRFFTITNTSGLKTAVNLDYLINFAEVVQGDATLVALHMNGVDRNDSQYTILATEDYTTVTQRAIQAGYM